MLNFIQAINAIIIGHVLCYMAIFLNFYYGQQYMHSGRLGIVLAIIGLAASYFHECLYVTGTRHPNLALVLHWTSVLSITASYLVWLSY